MSTRLILLIVLGGAGLPGLILDGGGSDASNHNFRTLMIGGRWSALAGIGPDLRAQLRTLR
jgi:hypothetical protein